MIYTIIIFIIVLSVIVFAHELGHFVSARIFGLKPREFGFGMPPRIFGIYRSTSGKWKTVWGKKNVSDAADTIYSLNALLLGGFVNLGEDDIETVNPNHFINKKSWQKAIILSAGVFMNIILAALLFSFGYLFGMPTQTEELSAKAIVRHEQIQVYEVYLDSPAEKAGLKSGDTILAIDGELVNTDANLADYFVSKENQSVSLQIKHLNEEQEIVVVPEKRVDTNQPGIGISYISTGLVRYPWYLAIIKGFGAAFAMFWAIIVAFCGLIKSLFVGSDLAVQVTGPVGIANITGQMARLGFAYLVQFTAFISLNLALINFLPFPALDGGRVLFLAIEKITGRPVKRQVEAAIHNFGFILLLILFAVVTLRDIIKLFN
jgi:regulator of sigma E protease